MDYSAIWRSAGRFGLRELFLWEVWEQSFSPGSVELQASGIPFAYKFVFLFSMFCLPYVQFSNCRINGVFEWYYSGVYTYKCHMLSQ